MTRLTLQKFLTMFILLATVSIAVLRVLPPPALPADAPADVFSAQRAVETIRAIAQSPRLVGSPAYEQARDYILAQLTALGLTPSVVQTTQDGVPVENIMGQMRGNSASDAILLVAHLDSVPVSPGATDDASGVAAVLETVRALRAGPPLENTIIVLITGPEENCCYGARAFMRQHPWAKNVRLVVNLDAGGLGGPSILAATGPRAGWLIREIAGVLPNPIGSSAIEALGSPATDYTLELRQDGVIGFDFNLSWDKRIHTPLDNVDNVNLASLQHQGEHMLAVARRFGNLPLKDSAEPRPIYFDLLGLTIVHYPVSWAIPLLLVVTMVLGGALFLGFRKQSLTLRGLASGVLPLFPGMLTVPLLLAVVRLIIYPPSQAAHPMQWVTELISASPLSNSIRWGTLVLALVTTGMWYAWFHKIARVKREDLVMGTYICLYLAALGTSVFSPALSYLFVWPLLLGLSSVAFWFSLNEKRAYRSGWTQFLGALGAAVLAMVLFVPGILIALLSIDIRMIYLIPVFVVAMLGFLVPPFEILFDGAAN